MDNKNVNRKHDSYRSTSRVVLVFLSKDFIYCSASRVFLVYSSRKLMMNSKIEYTRLSPAKIIVEILREEGICCRT